MLNTEMKVGLKALLVLLGAIPLTSLSGCNMANSGETPSSLAEPTADLSVSSVSRATNDSGYYYEGTTITVKADSKGSQGSSVTCVLNFDYKSTPTAEFVTLETFSSCSDYNFNLYNGPGIYRFKLTSTDGNSLVAEDQMFATAITDPDADIYLENEASAGVSIIGSTPDPDTNGYYFEDATLTVDVAATGSQRSDVTCVLSLAYMGAADSAFADVDTVNDCSANDLNLANGVGTYRIKLVATDANSKVAEDQKFAITIPPALADTVYMQADFTADVSTDNNTLFNVELDGTDSKEGTGGDLTTYAWELFLKEGDSTGETPVDSASGSSPITTFAVDGDGVYVAKLTITDASSNTAVTEKMFMVSGSGDTLIADFSVTVPAAAPVNLTVDASASTVPAGVDHYEWEVMAASAPETVVYSLRVESTTTVLPIAAAGDYLIRLTVIDETGNEHEITRIVTVS